MGKFSKFCNLVFIGLMAWELLQQRNIDFEDILIYGGFSLLAVLNILYIHANENEESLLHLWIKTKKKKLKDELDK